MFEVNLLNRCGEWQYEAKSYTRFMDSPSQCEW